MMQTGDPVGYFFKAEYLLAGVLGLAIFILVLLVLRLGRSKSPT
ncbi:MAG TPA: hypothetical protein VMH04_23565 [Candidatus Solibacter sp.]|nr:hypothetical protein [Candidatus Solibacter sp.]